MPQYENVDVILPERIECGFGCKEHGIPVQAKLDDKVYRFRNTRQYYVLYHCSKCNHSMIRLPLGESKVFRPVGLSRTAASRVV